MAEDPERNPILTVLSPGKTKSRRSPTFVKVEVQYGHPYVALCGKVEDSGEQWAIILVTWEEQAPMNTQGILKSELLD